MAFKVEDPELVETMRELILDIREQLQPMVKDSNLTRGELCEETGLSGTVVGNLIQTSRSGTDPKFISLNPTLGPLARLGQVLGFKVSVVITEEPKTQEAEEIVPTQAELTAEVDQEATPPVGIEAVEATDETQEAEEDEELERELIESAAEEVLSEPFDPDFF